MFNDDKFSMLNELDKDHNPSEVESLTGFEKPADGTYQVQLISIRVENSKATKRLQTVMEFKDVGNYGQHIWKYCGMESSKNLDYLTRDLQILGVTEQFKWSEVEKYFPRLLDKYYEITLKTKGEFQNVYIQKQIDITVAPKDDIPF